MALPELAFRPRQKASLGFEVLKLSELLARFEREASPHVGAPLRLDFHVVYVGLRGRGEVLIDFAPAPIGEGWVTVLSRGRVHQYTPASRCADAWMLVFTPDFDVGGPLSLLAPGAPSAFPAQRELLALCAQAAAEYARPRDELQGPLLASLCRTILLHVERTARATTPAIDPALARFYASLDRDAMRTRSVAHYARAAGVSARRLGELVQAHTGHTTKHVIADRALLEVKRLLAHTQLSIKELAARAGFSEPTNFVKFFRHRAGESPLAFRARFDHPSTRSHRGGREGGPPERGHANRS